MAQLPHHKTCKAENECITLELGQNADVFSLDHYFSLFYFDINFVPDIDFLTLNIDSDEDIALEEVVDMDSLEVAGIEDPWVADIEDPLVTYIGRQRYREIGSMAPEPPIFGIDDLSHHLSPILSF